MPVDNSPATNALNLLNGIDYGSVIGAPLQAAISAQAMAAKSTWEFIQEVGLQTDENGQKSAVNVSFTYQKDGELVKLIVPILTIVPIPAIVVTDIDIAFKVNINASASQSSEESEQTDIGGEVSGGAKVGWGAFSASANFKANYSSKKDSKATQDSQYSVEYTQDVKVKAGQAGMPAGLATVLNILSNAATGASLDGDLMVSPSLVTLDLNKPQETRSLSIRLVDSNGLNLKGADVTIKPGEIQKTIALQRWGITKNHLSLMNDPDSNSITKSIQIGVGPLGKVLEWKNNELKTKSGNDGTVDLIVSLTEEASENLPPSGIFELIISAEIDNKLHEIPLPFKVNVPEPGKIIAILKGKDVIELSQKESQKGTLTLTYDDNKPLEGKTIKVIQKDTSKLSVILENEGKTNEKGELFFTVKWNNPNPKPDDEETLTFTFSGDGEYKNVSAEVTVKCKDNEQKNILLPAKSSKLSFVDSHSIDTETVPVVEDTNK